MGEPKFGGNLKATPASSSWASAQQKSEAKVSAAKRVMDEALVTMSNQTSGAQNAPNCSETEKSIEAETSEDFDTCPEDDGTETEAKEESDACVEDTMPPTETR